MINLLIDADSMKYAAAFSVQSKDKNTDEIILEPINHAYHLIDLMIKSILDNTAIYMKDTNINFCLHITSLDKSNYRFALYNKYKEQRARQEKPIYFKQCHEYLKNKWNAEESYGREADDSITIKHYKNLIENNNISIISSIDKDFDIVPGLHYNPVKKEFKNICPLNARKKFYLQCLTGDVADNIPRIKKRWRSKLFEDVLDNCKSYIEMENETIKEIQKILSCDEKTAYKRLRFQGQLVWLQTYENELWDTIGDKL